jgi:hypothetical protein
MIGIHWLVVTGTMEFYVPYMGCHPNPIDELICFKMVIAPPTSDALELWKIKRQGRWNDEQKATGAEILRAGAPFSAKMFKVSLRKNISGHMVLIYGTVIVI